MALSSEVVASSAPKPRTDLQKPVRIAFAVLASSLLLVYWSSQRSEEVARAGEVATPERELEQDRKTADKLVTLAEEQAAKRAHDARKAAQLLGQGHSLVNASAPKHVPQGDPQASSAHGALPKVSEIIAGTEAPVAAEPWAPEAEDVPGSEPTAESRSTQIVTQHRDRMLQRRLQALEDAIFADSMRVDVEARPAPNRSKQASGGLDESDEQYPMRGLNSLSNALLQQSANQVRSGTTAGPLGALEALKGLAVPGIGSAQSQPDDGRSAKNLAFFQHGGDQLQPGLLVATVQKPLSPYELKMGTVIPGVLITAIHSESPGQILGQVSEHVKDSVRQDHILIPQGTKIVGTYSGAISIGQERVQVASVRLNFPNGDSLDLGGMSVADATGQAGLHDQVNNHLLRRVAATLLSTAATAGYEVSAPQNAFSPEGSVHRALGESIIKLANDMAARDAQIPPTLEIRAGGRFVINMNKDVVFPAPYQDEYRRRARDFDGPRRGNAKSLISELQ